jgi:putative hydrolase of the HAD superfamily
MTISHIFFDVGGVLGTGGWDTEQRAAAVDRFELDSADFGQRHQEAVGMFEEGRMTLDEYLDVTVFHASRPFTREEFKAFMRSQSDPFLETIAIARELADAKCYRLMTINNESAELNVHRLRRFRLIEIFATFFSSCWLGVTKPSRRIYELALTMSQANPERSVFIDDREQNLPPASALGMHTVKYVSSAQLATDLAALGIAIGERGER